MKHLQVKVLKTLHQKLICPILGCMPLNCLIWKFNFDDDTVIISEIVSRIIIFVLQDMRTMNISREMLKNSHVDKKIKNNVQKCPPYRGHEKENSTKEIQLVAPKKQL